MNAILGLSQLKRLDYNKERRSINFNTWVDNLDSDKYYVDFDRNGNSNFSLPLILSKPDKQKFDDVCDFLQLNDVEFRVGTAGGGNQARQPYLEGYDVVKHDLLNVDNIHDFGLYIGNHPELKVEDIIDLCEGLNDL